jgi:hypothetical protein
MAGEATPSLTNIDIGTSTLDGSASFEDVDQISPLKDKPFDQEPIKLTAEEVAQIWHRIDSGIAHQRKVFWPTYKDANALLKGEHWPEGLRRTYWDGQLIVNIVPNTVKSLVEAISYSEPDFVVHPLSREGEKVIDVAKSVLHYYWREANVHQQLKFMAWDSKAFGIGIGQVGWLFLTEDLRLDEGRMEVLPPGVSADDAKAAEQQGLLKPGEARELIPQDDVIEDRFQVQRINPMDFLVPPGVTAVVDNWPWCAKLNRVPLAKIKRDPRFRHSKRKHNTILSTADLHGTTKLSGPYDTYEAYLPDDIAKLDDERRPPDTKYVETVEYWERDRRLHVILCAEDRSKYVLVEKWSWQSKKFPFVTIHNTHTPDEFYGKSVPVEMWSIQINLNESYSQEMEHRRQFNRMYQAPENSLGDKAKADLMDGKPGTIVLYDGSVAQNPIQAIPHLQLQPELYSSIQSCYKAAELITGLSQYQMHSPPTKRLTATEAEHIQQAGGILFLADSQSFVKLNKDVGEHLLEFAQQYAPLIRDLPIYDDQGKAKDWINFTGDQIRGHWLLEIWPESTQPPDTSSDLQQNQQVLNILLQAAEASQKFGGQLPRPMAIVFREGLRIIGARRIDELLPLPPETPPASPGPPMAPPPQALPPASPGAPQPAPQGQPAQGTMTPEQIQQLLNSLGS